MFVPPQEKMYREFTIPKKNGTPRKICAPEPKLKRLQRSALKELYELFQYLENHEIQYGFIQHRNVVEAARKHIGFDSTTMMDISNFFDSVTTTMAERMLPSVDLTYLLHHNGYCAQGFVTSPIISAIAIIPLTETIYTRLNAEFKEVAFTVYADDIQVSINNPTKARIKLIKDIISEEVKNFGLQINEKKTRTRFSKYGYRRILGVNVGNNDVRATRKVMRKIRAANHQENGPSLGGLTLWSKCKLPKKPEDMPDFDAPEQKMSKKHEKTKAKRATAYQKGRSYDVFDTPPRRYESNGEKLTHLFD